MAVIKLTFQPDTTKITPAIEQIKRELNGISNINIKVDPTGAKATQQLATNLRDAANGAVQFNEQFNKIYAEAQRLSAVYGELQKVTATYGKGGELTGAIASFGKANEAVREFTLTLGTAGEVHKKLSREIQNDANIQQRLTKEQAATERQYAKDKLEYERETSRQINEVHAEQHRIGKAFIEQQNQYLREQAEEEKRIAKEKAKLEAARVQQERQSNAQLVKDEQNAQKQRSQAAKEYYAEQERQAKANASAAEKVDTLRVGYANLLRTIQNLKALYPEGTFDAIEREATEAQSAVQNLDKSSATLAQDVKTLEGTYKGLRASLAEVRQNTAQLQKVTESFWMNIQKFARWYFGGNIVVHAVRNIKEAVKTMKEVDQELTNIQKVSNLTSEEIERIGDTAYQTASKYGVAANEYLQAVYTFQKAGIGDNSEEMAELATKTMLVGDTTSEVATRFLISANAAWKFKGNVEELNRIVDEADKLNNSYAVTLEDIATGLPIVGATAAQVGMTAEQTMAAISTIVASTGQSASKASTALRAIIMNLIGQTGELEDGTEVTTESINTLNEVLNKYAGDAMKAAQASGKILDPMEAIAALAKAAEDPLVKETQLFEILAGLGGKLRTTQLTALINNLDMYHSMLADTADAAGTADREISVMLDSWNSRTQILKNTWTEFVSKTINSNVVKGGITALTKLVGLLNSGFGHFVTTVGLATVAIGALIKAFLALKALDLPALFIKLATNPFTWIALAVAAVYGLVKAIKALNPTAQELADKAAQAAENYKKLQSEIDQLNSKIEENNRLIAEANQLQDSDIYIARLQNENALLETQLGLLKAQAEEARKQANRDAKRAFNAASYGWESGQEAYRVQGETYYRPTYTSGTPLEYAQHLLERMRGGEDVSSEMSKVLGVLLDINESFDSGDEEAQEYSKQIAQLVKDYNGLNDATQKTRDNLKNIESSDPWTAWSAQAQAWGGLTDEDVERAKQWFDVAKQGAEDTETLYDELTRLSERRKVETEAIANASKALSEYGAYSMEAYDAMQALEKAIPGSTKNLYDFDTATLKVEEDTVNTEEALSNFVYGIKSAGNAAKEQLQYYSDLDSAINAVSSAMSSNGAKSIELYNAMEQLNKVAPEVVSEMYDLETAEWLVDSAQYASKNSLLDFIDAANSTKLTSLINELEKASNAALNLAGSIAMAMPGGYNDQFLEAYKAENNPALQKLKQQKADWDSYVKGLRERSDYKPTTTSTKTGSAADTELETRKKAVALLKSELEFLKAKGATDDEIIAKQKAIQSALHEQAEYMREVGADQAEINALSTEWWKIQKEIEALQESQTQTEEDLLKLEEERLKAAQELFDTIKKTVDEYLDKELSDKEKELALEEKILAVQQAQAALANAQKERNVRYFNAASGQWEWGANQKNVKAAQDALKKAQDDLNKYQKEQAWKEFKDAWEYVAEQIKAGAITFQQAYNYMETKMKEIQNKYNVDMGGVLRDSIGGFQGVNKTIKDLDAETAAQLGASIGQIKAQNEALAAATGSAKDAVREFKDAYDTVVAAVKSGDMSFDDAYAYLKQQAEIISAKYGTDMTVALDKAIEEMETIYTDLDSIKEAVKKGKITPDNAFEIISKALDSVSQKYGQDITGKVNKILDEKGGFKDGIGGLAQAVKDGKISIDDAFGYLEDATSEVADEYGINMTDELNSAIQKMGKSGEALDDLWKSIVLNKMRMNSVSWLELDEQKKKAQASGDTALAKAIGEQQDQLHAENEALGETIGATYDKSGHWSLNGSTLYDPAADRASGAFSGGGGGGGGGIGGSDAELGLSNKIAESHFIPGYGYMNVGQAVADLFNVEAGAVGNPMIRQLILREGTDAEKTEYLTTGKIPASFAARWNGGLHNIIYGGADGKDNFTGSFDANGLYTGNAIVYKGVAGGSLVPVVNGQVAASGLGDTGSNILLTPDGQVLRIGDNNSASLSGETWSATAPYDLAVYSLLQRVLLEMAQSGNFTAEELFGKMHTGVYDSGGLLHGVGGIKATARDEMVLPPDITNRLLSPVSNSFVSGRMDDLRSMLGMRTQFGTVDNTRIGTQNNGDNYVMNGVTISEGQARTTTVYDLAQIARSLGAYQRS